MLSLSGNLAKVITFAPQTWGEVDRFSHFYSTTYRFDHRIQAALRGIAGHFHKSNLLFDLANSIRPDLKKDREELRIKGTTSNKNGARLAAIVETIYCELYSTVDCTRETVAEIYKTFQGVTSKSTRRFFQNAADGTLDPKLPLIVREAFHGAQWFPELRKIRDAVTHSNVGSCHLDESTDMVRYMNTAVMVGPGCLVIEDVFQHIQRLLQGINIFTGNVFHELNKTLKDEEVLQVCGFFNGRVYTRFVRPSRAVNFNSGRCDALKWFDKDNNPRCPFAPECGAYKSSIDVKPDAPTRASESRKDQS
ncbi:MAG: hypothetical protein ACLQU4_20635 [Limisphaerales bacterium]